MKISCKEFARSVASDEKPRTLWGRFKFYLHNKICPHCSNFEDQVGEIGQHTQEICRDFLKDSQIDLNALRDRILDERKQRKAERGEDE